MKGLQIIYIYIYIYIRPSDQIIYIYIYIYIERERERERERKRDDKELGKMICILVWKTHHTLLVINHRTYIAYTYLHKYLQMLVDFDVRQLGR